MTSRRALAVLATVFLILGGLGLLTHATEPSYARDGAPIASLTLLMLGTACVAFLARNRA